MTAVDAHLGDGHDKYDGSDDMRQVPCHTGGLHDMGVRPAVKTVRISGWQLGKDRDNQGRGNCIAQPVYAHLYEHEPDTEIRNLQHILVADV
ncbi:hypothetical protein D3C73_1458890 [compost metagenome]